jgi:asparagine synthase (glutamine-hydrolysing)
MCGIFGFADWRQPLPPVERLAQATNLLRYRGPDGGAYWTENGAFLGHRRLAIIDLTTGDQPMPSRDNRYVLIFNGEIYNYPELREALRAEGGVFSTSSDTETIIEGYRLLGPAIVQRLEGMFAFAIYDRTARTLFLARDRFGEKPLLVADTPGRVVFASELSPLAAIGAGDRAIDLDALGGYLCLNYVPGERTMMAGIRRLAPATWELHSADGLIKRERYWDAGRGPGPRAHADLESTLDELQAHIDEAMRITLRADVPVGLFLSGGTDSGIVAESAARLGKLKKAFCVDFADAAFSEWPLAKRVADKIGVDIERVPLDSSAVSRFLEIAGHLDDPLADSSALPVWTVAQAASRDVKVVLSGDGGDELFGGYLTYPATHAHGLMSPWLPRAAWSALSALANTRRVNDAVKVGLDYKVQRLLRAMALPTREAHFTWNGTWTPREAARFVRSDMAIDAARHALTQVAEAHGLPKRPSMHQLQLADIAEYLPNDILTKVDRATMAHGLESRAPLLNRVVAEFGLTIPYELRATSRTRTKVLLRRLLHRHFGAEHANAPKQGFSIPIHRWLRSEGKATMTSLLAPDRVKAVGVLDQAAVADAMDAHLTHRRAYGWELWGLMVLVNWHEQRIASTPSLSSVSIADLSPVSVP